MQKKLKNPPKNWERNNFFCEGKLCIECKSEWQIYARRIIIRRNKIKEDKKKDIMDVLIDWDQTREIPFIFSWKFRRGKKTLTCY